MFRRTPHLLVLIVIAIVFYSLLRQLYDSLQISYRLDMETEQVAQLQKKNSMLKKKLEEVETVGFIEQQARDRLNLARPDEVVFIISQEEIDRLVESQSEAKTDEHKKVPNWQRWLRLFF